MATHSNILAWEIPQTEEPGGLQSTGLQRVRHNQVTKHILSSLKIIYTRNIAKPKTSPHAITSDKLDESSETFEVLLALLDTKERKSKLQCQKLQSHQPDYMRNHTVSLLTQKTKAITALI